MTTGSTFISGMVFAAVVVTAGCGGKRATTDDGPSVQPKRQKDLPPGPDLRLSNGKAGAGDQMIVE